MKTRDNFQNIGQTRHRQAFPALPEPSKPPAAYSPQPTVGGLRAAFTLIEVLVAMTVLSIMVLMAANIFQSSSAAWNIGTQKADMNTAARAALDYMVRELAGAVAGPVEAASLATPANILFKMINGSEIKFVGLSGNPAPPSTRALTGILFRYDSGNRIIETWRNTASFNPYSDLPAWDSAQMLITNVWSLNMDAFANESDLNNGVGMADYNSNSLPLCLDIALEMLSGDDMVRALTLPPGLPQDDFVARNSKVYSTRVYFPNRVGYSAR